MTLEVGIPVVVDPDYSRVIVKARVIAKQEGYAIAIHGSTTRDLDLIAIPWVQEACSPANLIARISFATGYLLQKSTGERASVGEKVDPNTREHGRLVWTLLAPVPPGDSPDWADPRYIDFSVIPPSKSS